MNTRLLLPAKERDILGRFGRLDDFGGKVLAKRARKHDQLLEIPGNYGTVGNNQGIGDFASQSLYGSGLYGAVPTIVYSPGRQPRIFPWETSKKTDIGIVFGLFNDRLQGEYTYFKNLIDGLVQNAPQAPSKGIPGNTIAINIGAMENTGTNSASPPRYLRSGNFSWTFQCQH